MAAAFANSGPKTNYFYDFQTEFCAVYAKSNGVLGSFHYHRYIFTHQSSYNSLNKGFFGWKSSEASKNATMGGKRYDVICLCAWSNIHWLSWKRIIHNWNILFIIIGSYENWNCRKLAAFEDEKNLYYHDIAPFIQNCTKLCLNWFVNHHIR